MPQETLSTELSWASTEPNVADEPTPVIKWDIPEGTELTVTTGSPAVMEMLDAGGNNINRQTRFGFAYREPNDPLDAWTVISDTPVAPFNALSLKDQQSGDNSQRRRIGFNSERVPGGSLTLDDTDTLALVVFGPEQVDDSTLFFNYPSTVQNR